MSVRCKCGTTTDYGFTCVACTPEIIIEKIEPVEEDDDYEYLTRKKKLSKSIEEELEEIFENHED